MIDETLEKMRTAIARGGLGGCRLAKCTTMRYNPTKEGPGPSTNAAVSVHTSKDNRSAIGYKLIRIVQRDIKFKTDKATDNYEYAHAGTGKGSQTLFWNGGNPSPRGKRLFPSHDQEDIRDINVVMARTIWLQVVQWLVGTSHGIQEDDGVMKGMIERDNFGVIKMVCPPKHDQRSAVEKPVFHLYTTSQDREQVGMKLISGDCEERHSNCMYSNLNLNVHAALESQSDQKNGEY